MLNVDDEEEEEEEEEDFFDSLSLSSRDGSHQHLGPVDLPGK